MNQYTLFNFHSMWRHLRREKNKPQNRWHRFGAHDQMVSQNIVLSKQVNLFFLLFLSFSAILATFLLWLQQCLHHYEYSKRWSFVLIRFGGGNVRRLPQSQPCRARTRRMSASQHCISPPKGTSSPYCSHRLMFHTYSLWPGIWNLFKRQCQDADLRQIILSMKWRVTLIDLPIFQSN